MWFYHATPSYGSRTRCLLAVPIFAAPGRPLNKLKTQLVNFFNYVFHSTLRHNHPLPTNHIRRPFSSCDFTGVIVFYSFLGFLFFLHALLSFRASGRRVYYAPHVHTIITIRTPKPTTGFRPFAFVVDLFRLRFFSRPSFLSSLFIRRNLSTAGATRQQRICTVILIPPSAETSAGHIWRNRGGIATIGGSGVE